MGGEKRENGGREGRGCGGFFDGFGYKGNVGLGGGGVASFGEVGRVMALGRCRGILVGRVGRMVVLLGMQRAMVMWQRAMVIYGAWLFMGPWFGAGRKVMAGGSTKALGPGGSQGP